MPRLNCVCKSSAAAVQRVNGSGPRVLKEKDAVIQTKDEGTARCRCTEVNGSGGAEEAERTGWWEAGEECPEVAERRQRRGQRGRQGEISEHLARQAKKAALHPVDSWEPLQGFKPGSDLHIGKVTLTGCGGWRGRKWSQGGLLGGQAAVRVWSAEGPRRE